MKRWIKLLLVCMLAMPTYVYAEEPEKDFDTFLKDMFVEYMENDYTSMHFTVKDYEKYGITKPEVSIGTLSFDDYDSDYQDALEKLEELEKYDYDSLSASQQHDYDAVHFYLERLMELNMYPYMDFIFDPNNGIHDSIITTMTEFVFYQKQDIDDYLSVLDSIDEMMNDGLEITRKQAEAGYFLSQPAIDSTLDSIDRFTGKTTDNELIIIFENNIDAFEGLSEEEKQNYKDRNSDIVLNTVIPSYKAVRDELESLRNSRQWGESVFDLPEGKEYYESLVKLKSSTNASVQELIDLCSEVINEEINNLYSISFLGGEEETIGFETPEEILEFLKSNLQKFPVAPDVEYTATYLDPSVANDGIVAYYLSPPIDDITNNVIKINGNSVNDINDLYSTLAHEGYPGHLYQTIWYMNTKPNEIRHAINMIGYTEGWAMYVEDFVAKYMPVNEYTQEMLRLNVVIGYILNAIADLGVNGLGWQETDIADFLTNLGLDSGSASDLYDFAIESPGVIVPYGVGLAQFLRIRNDAIEKMGNNFDYNEFHEVLLTYGPRPFEVVEKDVQEYIASKQGSSEPFVDDEKEDGGMYDVPEIDDYPYKPNYTAGWIVGGVFLALIALAIILGNKAKKKDILPYVQDATDLPRPIDLPTAVKVENETQGSTGLPTAEKVENEVQSVTDLPRPVDFPAAEKIENEVQDVTDLPTPVDQNESKDFHE